jgi:magnesium-transporting ATPase (P-type)
MSAMAKANVVIRELSALEALGGVTNICSDKTGTLTQGAMIVKKLWLPMVGIFSVEHSTDPNDPTQGTVTRAPKFLLQQSMHESQADYDHQRSAAALTFDVPVAKLEKDQQNRGEDSAQEEATVTAEVQAALEIIALCNLATVAHERVNGAETGKWQTTGEPTEIALQVFAHRFDFGKRRLESQEGWRQIAEFPFDSTIKLMSVVYNSPKSKNSFVFTKGAVERVIDICTSIGTGANNEPLTPQIKEQVLAQMDSFASKGQRVLAIASRIWYGDFAREDRGSNDEVPRGKVEQGLTFVGLAGIYDPPRDETKDAVRECSGAGITVHMLTVSLLLDSRKLEPKLIRSREIIPQQQKQLLKKLVSSLEIWQYFLPISRPQSSKQHWNLIT